MTEQTKGTLRAFLNTAKVKGDTKPIFEGKLLLPGSTEERPLALWVRQRKEDGSMMLTGRVEQPRGNALEQIGSLVGHRPSDLSVNDGKLKLKPGEVVLFENRNKAAAPIEKGAASPPDFYGWHHAGEAGKGLVDLGVWAKTDTNGRSYLTGSVKDRAPEPVSVQVHDATQDPEPVA